MAANTLLAMSSAVTLPELTAFCDMARAICWLVVSCCVSTPPGRLRSLLAMPVGTKYGHSTLQCTWSLTSRRSWYRVSVRLTTACLLTLYTPMFGGASSPAMLAVLTM